MLKRFALFAFASALLATPAYAQVAEAEVVSDAHLNFFAEVCENDAFAPWGGSLHENWDEVEKGDFLKEHGFSEPAERFRQFVFQEDQNPAILIGFSAGRPPYSGPSVWSRRCSIYFRSDSLDSIKSQVESQFVVKASSVRLREKISYAHFWADADDEHYQKKYYSITRHNASGWTKVSTGLTCSYKPRPSAFKGREGERKCPDSWPS
ncbi:MAG: hypothetical protein ABJP34_07330 [Erythrobacter sp.]